MTISRLQCFTLGLSILLCVQAHASVLNWGIAQNTLGPSDISTSGTLLGAFNAGQTPTTVNGILFQSASPLMFTTSNLAFLGGGTTGDAGLNRLLGEASFGPANQPNSTIALGSFPVGSLIEVQVFFMDQRSGGPAGGAPFVDRVTLYGSTDGILTGSGVSLEADPDNLPNSVFGQYAIGTMVSDGSPLTLTLAGSNYPTTQINAWQIRDITAVVPEIGSTTLLTMLTGLGAVTFKRRRH